MIKIYFKTNKLLNKMKKTKYLNRKFLTTDFNMRK